MALSNGSVLPNWLHGLLNEKDLSQIHEAVVKAESRTSGEIVPMIVHKSITTGHVVLVLFLLYVLGLTLLVPWASHYLEFVPLWGVEILAVVLALGLTFATRQLDFFQRLFTNKRDQVASVLRRAQLEFFLSNIKATQAQTGILIFVSVLEHQAVVLADQAIATKVPPETWKKIVDRLLEQIKAGECTKGLCQAIETAGEVLSSQFPIQAGDTNELPNALIIKE